MNELVLGNWAQPSLFVQGVVFHPSSLMLS